MKTPSLTLIISCSSVERQARSCIEHIRETQPVDDIELLLVNWEGYDYSVHAQGFAAVRTVVFPRTGTLKNGLARALRLASAEIVVFLEDHTRIHGKWAERLPQIFKEKGVDAVGWTIVPYDRTSSASWSAYLVEYGLWGPGVREGYYPMIPGHNSSYRRSALMEFDAQLEYYLQSENLVQAEMARRGKRQYLTNEFTLAHAQFLSSFRYYWADFWYGWGYADTRQKTRSWGYGRRIFYAAIIPVKIFIRWAVLLKTPRDPSFFPKGVVARHAFGITMGYLTGVLGEMGGYLFGTWKSQLKSTKYEIGYDRWEK